MSATCGGTGDARKPSDEEIEILKGVKAAVESSLGKSLATFEPVLVATQVVAGTNYFAKVRIDEAGGHVHVRVFKPLPHTGEPVQLHGVQADKQAEDELVYFERD